MNLHTEISPDEPEEIIIKCKERNQNIELIEELILNVIKGGSELKLFMGDAEYYIPINQILFFETTDSKISAHTVCNMYYTDYKLFELEQISPYFMRISKSCIVNTKAIISIKKDLTGSGEILFKNCKKKVYFSRNYYKLLKNKLEETRLYALKK